MNVFYGKALDQIKEEGKMHDTIIAFMGWEDMPASISGSLVSRIIRNNMATMADCCGEKPDYSKELSCLYDMIVNGDVTHRDIWTRLFIEDYYTLNDIEMQELAYDLRGEIEYCLKHGYTFEEARKEWDI